MLLEMSKLIRECSQFFYEYRIRETNHLYEFYKTIKSYEEKNHDLMHEFYVQLNKSLITPIDREDMMHLADHMDDILNWLDECASRFEMYNIVTVTDEMRQFSEYINKCTLEIHTCIERLSERKLKEMAPHITKVREYESICDVLERQCIKKIFVEYRSDVILLMQNKEIYENLEMVVDHCQNVVKVLETITMKNA